MRTEGAVREILKTYKERKIFYMVIIFALATSLVIIASLQTPSLAKEHSYMRLAKVRENHSKRKVPPRPQNPLVSRNQRRQWVHQSQGSANVSEKANEDVRDPRIETTVCQQGPFVTYYPAGRLGNLMCEYAHLMLIHLKYGVKVRLRRAVWERLHPIFPSITIHPLDTACDLQASTLEGKNYRKVSKTISLFGLNRTMSLGGFPCYVRELWPYRDLWRKEFKFSTEISKKAQSRKRAILETWMKRWGSIPGLEPGKTGQVGGNGTTVVGIHIRRTDYGIYLYSKAQLSLLPKSYFNAAMDLAEKRFPRATFFLVSDDHKWCTMNYLDSRAVLDEEQSPEEDLALLTLSDHVIISFGTFGLWGALLAPGAIFYPKKVGSSSKYFLIEELSKIASPDVVPVEH